MRPADPSKVQQSEVAVLKPEVLNESLKATSGEQKHSPPAHPHHVAVVFLSLSVMEEGGLVKQSILRYQYALMHWMINSKN